MFVRHCIRVWACSLPVDVYRNMSRRAVYFTDAQLRAITADKLRCGYFLLAVLSVLAVSLTLSAPDPTVDLQRDVLRARTVSVSVISHAVDTTAAFAWQIREPVRVRQRIGKHWRQERLTAQPSSCTFIATMTINAKLTT